MKKYNLSKIMKRAWEIKKENVKNIFSICLKMAWAEIKKGVNKMITTIKYSDYKNRYEGFEKNKGNYNAETKEIEIEINDKVFSKLQAENMKNAAIVLSEIQGLVWLPNMDSLAKQFVLGGSEKFDKWIEENAEPLKQANYYDSFKRAIDIMKTYNF